MNNRNALVGLVGCIKIPAYARMTTDYIIAYSHTEIGFHHLILKILYLEYKTKYHEIPLRHFIAHYIEHNSICSKKPF